MSDKDDFDVPFVIPDFYRPILCPGYKVLKEKVNKRDCQTLNHWIMQFWISNWLSHHSL